MFVDPPPLHQAGDDDEVTLGSVSQIKGCRRSCLRVVSVDIRL